MNKIGKTVFLTCTIYLAACMVISPTGCIAAARAAVCLCLDVVIPSLFPFLVCSSLFVALGTAEAAGRALSRLMRPLFRLPGAAAPAVVIGLLSGYPVGAKCAADLYAAGYLTKEEAERLTAFCNNSGPLFVIGAVGVGMLADRETGLLLYGIHALSALLVGLLFRWFGKAQPASAARPPAQARRAPSSLGGTLGRVVEDSAATMLKICGFVLLFSVFTGTLPQNGGRAVLYATLEITGGIRALLDAGSPDGALTLAAVSLFLAFSGLSVLMQVASVLAPHGLSVRPYLIGKLLQGGIAFLLTLLIFTVRPVSKDAFAAVPPPPPTGSLFTAPLYTTGLCALFFLGLSAAARLYGRHRK